MPEAGAPPSWAKTSMANVKIGLIGRLASFKNDGMRLHLADEGREWAGGMLAVWDLAYGGMSFCTHLFVGANKPENQPTTDCTRYRSGLFALSLNRCRVRMRANQ